MTHGQITPLPWCLTLATLLCMLVPTGCRQGESVEDRLKQAVRSLEQHWADDPDSMLILAALRNASVESLQEPHLVYVKVWVRRETITLWLYWVENLPTPDCVALSVPGLGFSQTICFDDLSMRENAKESKVGVVYAYVHSYDHESQEWTELRAHLATGKVQAVLMCQGNAVSNSVGVGFDAWPVPAVP